MNSTEIVRKHLQERIDTENRQQQEMDTLLKRHRMYALEAKGDYFESKRQQQIDLLKAEHKKQLDQLAITHSQEWWQWQNVKSIIRNSELISSEQEPKKKRMEEPEPEKTLKEKAALLMHKVKTKIKSREREM